MAFIARDVITHLPRRILSISLYSCHRRSTNPFNPSFPLPSNRVSRWFSSGSADSSPSEFSGTNAYELLGVSESSSFAEIKASFRKLAKETHPDVAESKNESAAGERFIQIVAAYEILSDSEKRAYYDQYLLSRRKPVPKAYEKHSTLNIYKSNITTNKQMEVVEWLRWYRLAINDILSEKKLVVGTGYFDVLEADFYSALHAAYYGPEIECMELLPNCFEAEERSTFETPEVLHLVSGRDLFGMVCLVNDVPHLSFAHSKKLASGMCQFVGNTNIDMDSVAVDDDRRFQVKGMGSSTYTSDAYKDLELQISGRVIAVATRVPPRNNCDGTENKDAQDHIHVFLKSVEDSMDSCKNSAEHPSFVGAVSRIPLGTITGLGTSAEEGSCYVYDGSGTKTHIIVKHRTLLVKHMHWYQLGDKVSICECRCTRARLPPSEFWLFEPRCGMHDIGGWYVETLGKDKKGRTLPSQRYWDGLDGNEWRLHPAMYLLALAYRTLDLEEARKRRQTICNVVTEPLHRILNWCKKLV